MLPKWIQSVTKMETKKITNSLIIKGNHKIPIYLIYVLSSYLNPNTPLPKIFNTLFHYPTYKFHVHPPHLSHTHIYKVCLASHAHAHTRW